MNILNEKLKLRTENLKYNNLYMNLDYVEKEKFEKIFQSVASVLSNSLEKLLFQDEGERKKTLLEFKMDMVPQAKSTIDINDFRGKIIINEGLIIHLYEMFYNLDYKIIVSDGKNIEKVKENLFLISIIIVIYHEIGHIYCKHANVKNDLDENDNRFLLYMNALELDADAFAITKLYELLTADKENKVDSNFWFKICIISIHALVYLYRQTDDFDKVENHPPFLIREIAMIEILQKLFKVYDIEKYINFYEKEFNRQFKILEDENEMYFKKMFKYKNNVPEIMEKYREIGHIIKKYSLLPVEYIDY